MTAIVVGKDMEMFSVISYSMHIMERDEEIQYRATSFAMSPGFLITHSSVLT